MTRMHVTLTAVLLTGCVTENPAQWVSINPGHQVSLDVATTVCDGEVAKADAANSADRHMGILWAARELKLDEKVRAGCMAQQGWRKEATNDR